LRGLFLAKCFVFFDLLKGLVEDVYAFLCNTPGCPKVTQLCRVVLGQKDVERLDVTMDYILVVEVMNTEAELYKHFPNEILNKALAVLLFDKCI
jgi:hypothetical protein